MRENMEYNIDSYNDWVEAGASPRMVESVLRIYQNLYVKLQSLFKMSKISCAVLVKIYKIIENSIRVGSSWANPPELAASSRREKPKCSPMESEKLL